MGSINLMDFAVLLFPVIHLGEKSPSTGALMEPTEEPILELSRAADWNAWLAAHYSSSPGVLLRIAKTGAKKAITYAEALDVALAWGWIDSQKRALDAQAWLQRLTPRKANRGRKSVTAASRAIRDAIRHSVRRSGA